MVPAPPPRAKVAPEAIAPEPPPSWAFRHRENMLGLTLDDGRRVEVGEHGERWLLTSRGRERATSFVPAPILGVARANGDEIGFTTKDGTVYPVKASDPLGPLGEPRKPPRELSQIAFGAYAMVARAGRDLVRSADLGRTWTPVDIGGAPRVLAALALARDGTGALLQLPQRTLVTDDDGLTWTHPAAPPHGVSEVKSEDDRSRVVAHASNGQASMQVAGKPPRWIPRRPSPAPATNGAHPPSEPVLAYADAWTTGAGALAGTSWLEMAGTETGPELWLEDLTGVAPSRRIRAFPECADATRVGASADGRVVGVVCRKSPRSLERLVFRSIDGGRKWEQLPPLVSDASALFLGVRVFGEQLIVVGACAPDRASPCPLQAAIGSGAAWSNLALHAKVDKQLRLDEVTVHADGFVGMAYDDSGDTAFAIVSRGDAVTEVTKTFDDLRGVEQLSSDGKVLVLKSGNRETPLHLSHDGGRTWTAKTLPVELDDWESVSFAGARGLAMTPTDLFESIDAGTTWSRIETPPLPGPPQIRCGARACLIDDTVRRIGWSTMATGARPKAAATGPRTIAITDPGGGEPLLTCTPVPGGKTDTLQGSIDAPLVDLAGGAQASFLVYGAEGVKVVRDRGGAREVLGPIKRTPPLGFQVVSEADGAVFAEFPGECALNCHGFLYSSTGPIVVSWLPASGGPVRRLSFTPDDKMLRQPIDARVTADGGVIVAVAEDAYVFDANGKRTKKVRGHAWDVVTIDKKTYSTIGAITFLEIGAGPAASSSAPRTWVFEPFASEGGHITRARGQAFAWTQVKSDAFLVKLDKLEEEPSTVIGIDVEKLLTTKPLGLCTAKTRGELRVPITFDPPSPSFRVAIADPAQASSLAVSEVVLRSNAEGKACVSGVVALSSNRQHGVMVDVSDLAHATTWKNGGKGPATTQSLRCVAGRQ